MPRTQHALFVSDISESSRKACSVRYVRGAPDACWLWTGRRDRLGYGRLTLALHGRREACNAHRIVYALERGDIPAGRVIMHTCDNPSCVNPTHLVSGTPAENVADMDRKGRGVRNGKAKLTAPQVRELLSRFITGEHPRTLARSYGIAYTYCRRLLAGKTWRHVRSEFSATDLAYACAHQCHGLAKLTDRVVRELRQAAASGISCAELANQYRITYGHCWSVITNKRRTVQQQLRV